MIARVRESGTFLSRLCIVCSSVVGCGDMTSRSVKPSLGTVPMAVGTRSTMGNQTKSTVRSNPSFGFGTATREMCAKKFISHDHKEKDNSENKFTPGPGTYNHRVATGRQSESSQRTAPQYGFGSSVRFDKISEKRTGAIPGPGAYLI